MNIQACSELVQNHPGQAVRRALFVCEEAVAMSLKTWGTAVAGGKCAEGFGDMKLSRGFHVQCSNDAGLRGVSKRLGRHFFSTDPSEVITIGTAFA